MKPNLCIYHGNCADGFTAAWVVRNALGEKNVEFMPGFYHEKFEVGIKKLGLEYYSLFNFDSVYLVDFSYKKPILEDLARQCKRIVIIDHHKTAQQDLVNLPANVECHFDMDHSGAMLTWMYFEATKRITANSKTLKSVGDVGKIKDVCDAINLQSSDAPALIQRVEDRDLWRFKFSDTRTVQANIFSYEYTFENWDRLAEESMEKLAQDGTAIERKHFKDIKELLAVVQTEGIIGGHKVPVANLPYTMSSDAGHIMGVDHPFAACYWITKDGITFSLRSAENGIDVSEIAKKYGGGGHKNAAGFSITWLQYIEFDDLYLDILC